MTEAQRKIVAEVRESLVNGRASTDYDHFSRSAITALVARIEELEQAQEETEQQVQRGWNREADYASWTRGLISAVDDCCARNPDRSAPTPRSKDGEAE